ncbi:hypothetical protein VHUM_04048 [Vanrija humicola]|uniref:Autophagy-related protein n=1 Tax=Vanrija humicola TaxID=5417 RepID=A0A7D8YWH4_VANHU|nr:hypothetical protein VHUM_04048 [Vanrija humicola]
MASRASIDHTSIDDKVVPEVIEAVPAPAPASVLTDDEATLFASPLPITGERKTTTRKELWSWYLYYVGNSGLGPFNFAISAWQNLLYQAGWDPALPRGTAPCGSDTGCVLEAYGHVRDINSIVYITNGLSFASQAVLFLIIGSFADYGTWRPHITTGFTVLAWAVSFGWLGVMTPDKWRSGTALYILGLIGYQGALTFWTAAFPGLARDLPEMQDSEHELAAGQIDQATFEKRDMLQRNRLANVSFFVCSVGELVVLAILAGILVAIITDAPDSNTKALSYVCAYSAGVWSELAAAASGGFPNPHSHLRDPVAAVRAVPAGQQAAAEHYLRDRRRQADLPRVPPLPPPAPDLHLPRGLLFAWRLSQHARHGHCDAPERGGVVRHEDAQLVSQRGVSTHTPASSSTASAPRPSVSESSG